VSTREQCDSCGFVWDDVIAAEIANLLTVTTDELCELLVTQGDLVSLRPEPERWSSLEYGAHLRDVYLSVRDRIVVACVEVEPTLPPLYREERVAFGFYELDTVDELVNELQTAAKLFNKVFEQMPESLRERRMQFAYPIASARTLSWVASQVYHEAYHHLGDVRANLERLTT
jgi:hypothetical protein